MSNPQLWHWFDDGAVVPAVLGAPPYFVRDHTYLDTHDRLLVIGELVDWSRARQREDGAARDLVRAVEEAVEDGDTWSAYDVVWCYLLVADGGRELPGLDLGQVSGLLDRADSSATDVPPSVDELRSAVRGRLSELTG